MVISQPDKNQQGFHLVGVLFFILALCIVGFVGYLVYQKTNNSNQPPDGKNYGPSYKALSSCDNKRVLTTLPTDLSRLDHISPLGGVNVPDHTLPTDHMYMMYPHGESDQKEIYAPADVVVTAISYGGEDVDGSLKNADYRIDVYPCHELRLIFGHVDVLGEKLAAAVGADFSSGKGCSTNKQGDREYKNCFKDVDITISAGELLGTSDGWDLWATMEGFKSPNVTSPAYYHNVDAVCPLDYFTDELKAQLYAKVRRDSPPKCGEAYQDKANTLQGGWFGHKDPEKAKTDWSSHFSLVHHPQETKVGMLAVAGTIADPFMYRFTPRNQGTINREPSQTTSGTLYCYQHEGDQRMPNGVIAGTGKVLLKLIDNHVMHIEHQAGACTTNESFSKPVTYYR